MLENGKNYRSNEGSYNSFRYEPSGFSNAAGVCKICGRAYRRKAYKCRINESGNVALCYYVPSIHGKSKDGKRWIHFINESDFKPKSLTAYKPQAFTHNLADSEKLDVVYRAFLELLTLEVHHGDELLYNRQLSDCTIVRNLYASVPDKGRAKELMKELVSHKNLIEKGYDLKGVAGFFINSQGFWNMALSRSGFYVPYTNSKGHIVGLQIRLDKPYGDAKYIWFSSSDKSNGTAQTMPIHFAKPHLIKSYKKAFFTEGALKSDIIAERLDCSVIASAGTGISEERAKNIAEMLKCEFPELEKIILAPDADYKKNADVKRTFAYLKNAFRESGFVVKHLKWNEKLGKGLDDVLNADNSTRRD